MPKNNYIYIFLNNLKFTYITHNSEQINLGFLV